MKYKIKNYLNGFKRLSYVNNKEIIVDDKFLDCSLGVNPFGYTSKVDLDSFNLKEIHNYPKSYGDLKKEIINYWDDFIDLKEANINLGSGSMDILERISKLFIDKGSCVIGYCPQFPEFKNEVECNGGKYKYVNLKAINNYRFDENDLIQSIDDNDKLIYLDNPNNPTGQIISIESIENILKYAYKKNICVIVDEAYGDFIDRENSSIKLINKYKNLLVIRSFSKGLGLAGIRIGYLVSSSEFSNLFNKVTNPFTANSIGSYLAMLSLTDQNFIEDSKEKIRKIKSEIKNSCINTKILFTSDTVPIFVLKHSKGIDLREEFYKRNILVTSGESYIGLGANFARIRVPKDYNRFIEAILSVEKI